MYCLAGPQKWEQIIMMIVKKLDLSDLSSMPHHQVRHVISDFALQMDDKAIAILA